MNFNMIKSKVISISLTELEEMLPFERDIYINLYMEELRKIEESKKK